MTISSSTQPSLKARVLPRFPANVVAGSGMSIVKNGSTYTFSTIPTATSGALPVNPVDYGADPTGVNDSYGAIVAALAASSWIAFPPGNYKCSGEIVYTVGSGVSLVITGAGQDKTNIRFLAAGFRFIYTDSTSSAHIRDMSILAATNTSFVGVTLVGSLINSAQSDITRVTFRGADGYAGGPNGWAYALTINTVSNVNVVGCTFWGDASSVANGIIFEGDGVSVYAIALNVTLCYFVNMNVSIVYGSWAQGVIIANNNFTLGNTAVLSNSVDTSQDELIFVGNQVGTFGQQVWIITQIQNVIIANNYFITGATAVSVRLTGNKHFSITGNNFYGAGASTAILIGPTAAGPPAYAGVISGNVLRGVNSANDYGIYLDTGSKSIKVVNNTIVNHVFPFTDLGTSNTTENNTGYNPVGISAAAAVGASPATITAGSSPETHYVRQSATNTATITKGGQQIATLAVASVYYVVELRPHESYVVTWVTTQPTYTKDVH